ncbi:MAG: 4-deoxy-4-formamido-L-arabinose-phosphoundecaprenol deformylase, partial [bacterium]
RTPQIPVTLPTYDEMVGRNGVNDTNYNDYVLQLLRHDALNVLTIHAEAEGRSCRDMFNTFIKAARARGATFAALGTLPAESPAIGTSAIVRGEVRGREGWVAVEAEADNRRSGITQ